jgi:hypothetical protein
MNIMHYERVLSFEGTQVFQINQVRIGGKGGGANILTKILHSLFRADWATQWANHTT